MLNAIIDILENNHQISDWIIEDTAKSTLELFFVRDRLDMHRRTNIHDYAVRVFVNFTDDGIDYKGDAEISLGAGYSPDECRAKIEDAVVSASFVKNKSYDLPDDHGKPIALPPIDNIGTLEDGYEAIFDTCFKPRPYPSKINSLELFATNATTRIVTSHGLDMTFPQSSFMFEPVTDADIGKEPVEIFNDYTLRTPDLDQIDAKIDRQLRETEERSKAVQAQPLKHTRVILTGNAVPTFLSCYTWQATDRPIYKQQSRAKLGERFMPDNARQTLNIRIDPTIPSPFARPVDREGKRLEAYPLYRDGVVENLRTGARYSHYLGIPNRGTTPCFSVAPGDQPLAHYMQDDYTEIVTFSSFLCDPLTGDFGGEFRLARQHIGNQTSYITGGAIADNLFNCQANMCFSKELETYDVAIAPKAIILNGLDLT
jgi:predicted Zn-dependent protease